MARDPVTPIDYPGVPLPDGLRSLLAQVDPEDLVRLDGALRAEMEAVNQAEKVTRA